jgi:hypothetical protein
MRTTFILVALLSVSTILTSCEKNDGLIEGNKSAHTPQPREASLRSTCEGGDDEDPAPLIYGNVLNPDSLAIEGVCVQLWLGNSFIEGTGTDENGHYYFNTASNGIYSVRFERDDFEPDSKVVTISEQVPMEANIILVPKE